MSRVDTPATPSPFHVVIDATQRLVRTTFRGNVRPADMKTEVDRLTTKLAAVGPGFTLVTDLVELEHMDIDCVSQVTRMMDTFMGAGVGKVLRVIPHPEKDIGFNMLSLTHYRGRVPTSTFKTRQELEAAL